MKKLVLFGILVALCILTACERQTQPRHVENQELKAEKPAEVIVPNEIIDELKQQLIAKKETGKEREYLADVARERPEALLALAKKLLDENLEEDEKELNGMGYYILAGEHEWNLVDMEIPGAYEFLMQCSDPAYWERVRTDRDLPPARKTEESYQMAARSFQLSLWQASYYRKDTKLAHKTLEFFQHLYEREIEAGRFPSDVVQDALVFGLHRVYPGSSENGITDDNFVDTYLSKDYPAGARCISYFNFTARENSGVQRRFEEILSDKNRKKEWPLAIRALASVGFQNTKMFNFLKSYFESRFSGEVDQYEFEALVEVPTAITLMMQNEPAEQYVKDGSFPDTWERKSIPWTFRELKGEKLELFLAQLFLKNYALLESNRHQGISEKFAEKLQMSGRTSDETEIMINALRTSQEQFRKSPQLPYGLCHQIEMNKGNPAADPWNYPF